MHSLHQRVGLLRSPHLRRSGAWHVSQLHIRLYVLHKAAEIQLLIAWMSDFVTLRTALPIMQRMVSHIPMGRTPGSLLNGISRHAVRAARPIGSVKVCRCVGIKRQWPCRGHWRLRGSLHRYGAILQHPFQMVQRTPVP